MKIDSLLDCDKRRVLTQDESALLANLIMMELSINQGAEIEKNLSSDFIYQIMKKRLAIGKVRAYWTCMAFVVFVCNGNPGKAVMWCYTLACIFAEEKKPVSLQMLINYFPSGFPTEEGMRETWDKQKGHNHGLDGVDNIIDNFSYWPKVEV